MDIQSESAKVSELMDNVGGEGHNRFASHIGLPSKRFGMDRPASVETLAVHPGAVTGYSLPPCDIPTDRSDAVVRLDEIAKLTSSVGHEIANSLTVVMLTCSWISDSLSWDDPRLNDIKNLSDETAKIRLLLRGLIDFVKPTKKSTGITDVSMALGNMIGDLSANIAGQDTEWMVRLPGPLLVQCSIGQVNTILKGVLLSSMTAFRRGIIAICGSGGELYHTIEVSGQFDGDRSEIGKMLDPVHSVKAYGCIGLALINSRKTVSDLGGSFLVEDSYPGQLTFRLSLPAARG